jgi:hypothetical protein
MRIIPFRGVVDISLRGRTDSVRHVFLGILLPLMAWLLPAASAWAGAERVTDGVIYVQSDAAPPQGVETIELKELWRIGGEDDEVFFGNPSKVLLGPDGNIYIEDEQLVQVFVYSPDGEFLRTLGRQGEGPGEVRSLNDIIFLPDGTLGLGQAFPGRVVRIGLDGTPGSSFPVGGEDPNESSPCVFVEGMSRSETILIAGMRMEFRDQGSVAQHLFLARYNPEGTERNIYVSKEYSVNFAEFVLDEKGISFVWSCFDADSEGRVYFTPRRDAYEIHVHNPEGELERVITREYESLKRDDEMKTEAELTMEAVALSYNVPLQGVTIEDDEQDIEFLHVAPDNRLWIRTSRGDRRSPQGVLTTYDVFDSAGHFQQQIQLRAPGQASRDAIYMLGEDRVAVVIGAVDAYRREQGVSSERLDTDGEPVPLEVIVYAM